MSDTPGDFTVRAGYRPDYLRNSRRRKKTAAVATNNRLARRSSVPL